MNYEIKKQILNRIKENDRIMLFRHIRNDGDCVGATKGMKRLIQCTWPEKEVYIVDTNTAEYLKFLGPEDEEVSDEFYAGALGIVLDTASEARISNKKYKLSIFYLKRHIIKCYYIFVIFNRNIFKFYHKTILPSYTHWFRNKIFFNHESNFKYNRMVKQP